MSREPEIRKPPRFRISGVTGAITASRQAEVLDLSLRGALVEHQGMLRPEGLCSLELQAGGELLTIRCRVVHSQVSRSESGEGVHYQSGLEFLDLTPWAEQALGALIRSYGDLKDQEGENPEGRRA
ncbi:MAG: PilZ domain-containing protein [Candidatus Methylomirabilales bacterium]